MAYFVGTANSLADLQSAFEAALGNTGFTESSGIYVKNDIHAKLSVVGDGVSIGSVLNLSVGNSASGSVLEDFRSSRIGPQSITTGVTSWSWPVAYHIHILENPSEAYMLVNYGSFWQSLSLGQSPAPGNPGTGIWVHGSIGGNATNLGESALSMDANGIQRNYYYSMNMSCCIPFFEQGWSGGTTIHTGSLVHGVYQPDGSIGWNPPTASMVNGNGANPLGVSSATPLAPLLGSQPNSWNLEAILLPCQVFQRRLENKSSLVIELSHLRITRNDYLPDGEVITLGSDRWKIYSAYRRDTTQRNGSGTSSASNHSGTFAIAIRYDGP